MVQDGGGSWSKPPNFGTAGMDGSAPGSFAGSFVGKSSVIGISGNATPGGSAGLGEALGPGCAWEQDKANCSSCGVKFSKTNRPHHCRMCGQCICHTCSPSSVTLDSWKGTQRVCNACVSLAPRAQNIRERVLQVGRQLHNVHSEVPELYGDASTTLADAVQLCEREILPLKVGHARATQSLNGMSAALAEMAGKDQPSSVGRGLEEAIKCVDALVEPASAKLQEAEAQLEKERAAKSQLEAKLASLTSEIAAATNAAATPVALASGRGISPGARGAEASAPALVESGPLYQLADRNAREEKKGGGCSLQ